MIPQLRLLSPAASVHRRRPQAGSPDPRRRRVHLTYAKGLGVPADEVRAVELLQLACRAGSMAACSDLSSHYFLGTGGVERSDAKGIELLTRACDHGHSSSCFVLGLRHRKGVSVPKNEGKALEYLKKACDGGDKMGCEQLSKSPAH
jgi:uncharacterized protein